MSRLAELIRNSAAVLLDFDGPVCGVFSGYPAGMVATELRQYLTDEGVQLPPELRASRDPLQVLAWVGASHADLSNAVEDRLIAAEILAVDSASPTPHADDVITAAVDTGRPVAIVSNNSAAAIHHYLALHGLDDLVSFVVGRLYARPERMKPRPDSVLAAAKGLTVAPDRCVLVGDSPSDMAAALAIGARPIGFAKNPHRRAGLLDAGAEVVVSGMGDLVGVLVPA